MSVLSGLGCRLSKPILGTKDFLLRLDFRHEVAPSGVVFPALEIPDCAFEWFGSERNTGPRGCTGYHFEGSSLDVGAAIYKKLRHGQPLFPLGFPHGILRQPRVEIINHVEQEVMPDRGSVLESGKLTSAPISMRTDTMAKDGGHRMFASCKSGHHSLASWLVEPASFPLSIFAPSLLFRRERAANFEVPNASDDRCFSPSYQSPR